MLSAWSVAAAILLRENHKMTYIDIADKVLKSGLTRLGKKGKTPERSINNVMTTTQYNGRRVFKSLGNGEYYLNDPSIVRAIPKVQQALLLLNACASH